MKRKQVKQSSISTTIGAVTGLVIGSVVAGQIFMADANFRTGLASQDANKAIAASLAHPEDLNRTLQIASILARNSLIPQANELLDHIIKKNPRSFGAWELRYRLSTPNSSEWEKAKSKLKYLNPKAPIA
jgi:urea transporter